MYNGLLGISLFRSISVLYLHNMACHVYTLYIVALVVFLAQGMNTVSCAHYMQQVYM